MEFKPEILEKLRQLEEKYAAMGQDLASYLDGLLYADFLTYWEYIHLDTLLSLQNPKTGFPDENIFIMYHQITELYFKLCLHEYKQIAEQTTNEEDFILKKIKRINTYFHALINSFEIMVEGMEQQQFLKFRMSLLPASGFQSAQYRKIEICSTEMKELADKEIKAKYHSGEITTPDIRQLYQNIYWKKGATELASGKKTLTLVQFEKKYSEELVQLAEEFREKNLYSIYKSLPGDSVINPDLINELKQLDVNININWPLSHYKSAVRYLQRDPVDIAATGGTNWQKYLPPRFQKRIFFPEIWTTEEIENWGKTWVKSIFNDRDPK